MRIRDRQLGPDEPPYVVAEIGVNHDGREETALDLVEAACHAGADAIKLQLFETERLVSRGAPLAAYQETTGAESAAALLRPLELDVATLERVADRAHRLGLHAIVTVFNIDLVDRLAPDRWDAFKVASPDLVNRPLVHALMATGKPLILSTGAATLEEVRETLSWLGDHPFAIMQCVSAYPTPDESASLGGLETLRGLTPAAIGYSDHTRSVDAGALAVAAGARLLEKHMTHDRSAPGPDHHASLEPGAFAEYVRLAHRAHAMIGSRSKTVLPIEEDVRRAARQTIVAARPLTAGHRLARADLAIKRAGGGVAAGRLETLLGRTLRCDLEPDRPLREEDVE